MSSALFAQTNSFGCSFEVATLMRMAAPDRAAGMRAAPRLPCAGRREPALDEVDSRKPKSAWRGRGAWAACRRAGRGGLVRRVVVRDEVTRIRVMATSDSGQQIAPAVESPLSGGRPEPRLASP